jgi:glycosyltransferase involved in cell wall biosynthesis
MVRVLHIIPGLKIGGAETLLYNWLKHSKRGGMKYHVICLSTPDYYSNPIQSLGIPVTHLGLQKNEGSFLAPFKVLKEVYKLRPHIIHSHCVFGHYRIFPLIKVYSLLTLSKYRNIQLVHTIHGSFTFHKKKIYWYESLLNKINVAQVAVGRKVREHHRSLYNNKTNIQVIPNGIPTKNAQRIKSSQFDYKIVTVANLVPNIKGYEISIQAIQKLSLTFPKITYHIFGEGELRHYIEDFVKRHHLEDIIYLHGHSHSVAEKLSEMDIYLLPSTTEGMPLSLLEAISSGLPIISTKVGDIPNLLSEQNAILVEPNQVDSIVEALSKMVLEEDYRKKCHESNLRLSKQIDIQPMIRKYELLYHNITASFFKSSTP